MATKTAQELADDFVQKQKDMHDDPDSYRGYRFPSPWFMKLTGGWGRGWLCFVYAKAGMGKTSMLTTASVQLGKDQVDFMYFSLEESLEVTAARMFSNLEPINRTKFRDVKLADADWPNVFAAASEVRKFNAWFVESVYDEKGMTAVIKQFMPRVILLDYTQLMDFPGKTMTERMVQANKWLQGLSRGAITGQKHLVIAAAQLNDNGEVLYSRDSDRHGDLILGIDPIDDGFGNPKPDERRVTVRKFRYGSLGYQNMAFIGSRSLIGDLAKPMSGPIPKP